MAAAALAPLLERASCCYSPLVLYGPTGSGKSHLACGLADSWRERQPAATVMCLTGAEFARAHADALGTRRLDAWRAGVRSAKLFILDDLGELADKRPAQQELLHTLDALADREALALVTARALPARWSVLLPALRGRLSGGLVVSLALPSRATRRVLLDQLADARGVALPAEVLDELASRLEANVPSLLSALLELELAASTTGQQLDGGRVGRLVTAQTQARRPTLREIARLTAKHFGLRVSDLQSPARRRTIVAGRAVAMYLARQLTASSLGQIGKFFGGRDHTTVLYGCRRTEKLLTRDRRVRQAVAELKKALVSP